MKKYLALILIPLILSAQACGIDDPREKKQCKVNIVGKTITQDCR